MSGVLGDIKQQLGDLGKQMGQSVVSAPKETVKTVVQQIGIEIKDKEVSNQKPPQMDKAEKQASQDFVKELYGVSSNQKPVEQSEENPDKSPQDIQKMMSLRQKLHGEYYQKLITPQGRPEEAQEKQEREVDRMERLGVEDLQEKKKEEEKKKPIAVLLQERKTEAPLGAG